MPLAAGLHSVPPGWCRGTLFHFINWQEGEPVPQTLWFFFLVSCSLPRVWWLETDIGGNKMQFHPTSSSESDESSKFVCSLLPCFFPGANLGWSASHFSKWGTGKFARKGEKRQNCSKKLQEWPHNSVSTSLQRPTGKCSVIHSAIGSRKSLTHA